MTVLSKAFHQRIGPLRDIFPIILLVSACHPAFAAVLSASGQTVARGQTAVASLAFSAEGESLSGIQFDLEWDPALDIKLVIGDQLRQSSKLIYTATRGPQALRCVIVGMNADVIPDGELLKLFIIPSLQASPGTAQLRITNTVATDPGGSPAPFTPSTVDIAVQGGSTAVAIPAAGILNAASLLPGPISPGEVITLLGGFPKTEAVLFNGVSAPILYAAVNQVNAIVPFGLNLDAPAVLEMRLADRSGTVSVPVAPVNPALFTQTAAGSGPGAILNQDYSVNSASNPASRDSVVMLFGTGFGPIDPQPSDGEIASGAALTRLSVTATVDGVPATVTYAGAAPGLIAGVTQINVQIPAFVAPNPAAQIVLSVGSASTPVGVTVAVQ